MLNAEFYNLQMDALGALYSTGSARLASTSTVAQSPPALLQLRAGLAESPGWFLIQAAEFDPEPLTVERLRVRDTYASERIVQALLDMMASEQWLDRSARSDYMLTKRGRAIMERRLEGQRELVAHLNPLPDRELTQLASLLGRVIDASLAAPAPPGAWCLAHSRRRAPAPTAPPLTRIAHYLSDFNAFRDDAHMAAWRSYNLEGYEWEAFALHCAGEANSAASLFEQLAHRGYTIGEYAAALEHLTQCAWLAPGTPAGTYQVTAEGRAAREVVERLTDAYFYAPWACLADTEIDELHGLLELLIARLQALETDLAKNSRAA